MTCHCGKPIRGEGDECNRCAAITRGKQTAFGAAQRARFRDEPGLPAHLQPTTPRTDLTIPDAVETQEMLKNYRSPAAADGAARVRALRKELQA